MNAVARGLMWPVISLIAIGSTHLVAELVRPELQAVFTPPVVMPIYLVAGAWAAMGTTRAEGGVIPSVGAAAILGLLPVGLQLVGFGMIAGRDGATVATSAMFGFLAVAWGGFLGAGIGRSIAVPARAAQSSEARNRSTGAAVA